MRAFAPVNRVRHLLLYCSVCVCGCMYMHMCLGCAALYVHACMCAQDAHV